MKDHEFAELPHPPALSRPGEIRRVTKPVRMLVYWGWSVVFTIALIVVVLELFGKKYPCSEAKAVQHRTPPVNRTSSYAVSSRP
jgi:hypothetical protein